jgi:hypothetical protein
VREYRTITGCRPISLDHEVHRECGARGQ